MELNQFYKVTVEDTPKPFIKNKMFLTHRDDDFLTFINHERDCKVEIIPISKIIRIEPMEAKNGK